MKRNKMIFKNIFWAVKKLYNFNKIYFLFLTIDSVLKGITPVILLIITQQLLNNLQMGKTRVSEIIMLVILLSVVGLLDDIITNVLQVKIESYEMKFEVHMQTSIFEKISKLDCKDFENSDIYDLINRTQYDANAGVIGNIKILFNFISLLLGLISYVIIIIQYSVFILCLISIMPIIRFIYEKKYNLSEYTFIKKNTEKMRRASYISYLITNAEYYKEIKLFSLFNHFILKYRRIKTEYNEKLIQLHRKRTNTYSVITIIESIMELIILIGLIKDVILVNLLIGEFILYNSSINTVKQNIVALFSQISILYKNSLIIEQIKLFFDLPLENINFDGIQIERIESIKLVNVSYRYKGKKEYTLKNININIRTGELCIFMGYNGAGKSTLIKLIMGIYSDYEGEIYVNNINLKELDLEHYRKKVGVLFQDYIKYETSISENIWYGNMDFYNDELRVEKYLRKIGLKEFIKSKRELLGYQFKEGRQISIGQWQKLALARTLNRDASMYIFDEPNAALDLISEKIILDSIHELIPDSVVIMIMHRVSNIVFEAKNIVVLKDGQIHEIGTHEELIRNKGLYFELYQIQNGS